MEYIFHNNYFNNAIAQSVEHLPFDHKVKFAPVVGVQLNNHEPIITSQVTATSEPLTNRNL